MQGFVFPTFNSQKTNDTEGTSYINNQTYKAMKSYLLLFCAMPLVMACSSDDIDNGERPTSISLTRGEQQIASANSGFAMSLFGAANEINKDENMFVVSPLSASLALSMTANGAGGSTLDEMVNVLGVEGHTLGELNAYNKKIVNGLPTLDGATVSVANAIWIDNSFSVLDAYKDSLASNYDANIQQTDLASSVSAINDWCNSKTNGYIPKIVDEISSEAKIVLLNALYFNGLWESPFDKGATVKDVFNNADGTQGEAEYMSAQYRSKKYGADDDFTWVELPFKSSVYNLSVILPNEGVSVSQCIAAMQKNKWDNFSWNAVNLKLPKFSIRLSNDLIPTLRKIGINEIFSNTANMTNLSSMGTMIAKVQQANFFSIDEEGAKAAAVTEVEGWDSAPGPIDPNEIIDFNVNRPFIFMLTEQSTGCVLFMGRVSKM